MTHPDAAHPDAAHPDPTLPDPARLAVLIVVATPGEAAQLTPWPALSGSACACRSRSAAWGRSPRPSPRNAPC
ncbi:hypothetical protein ACFQDE_06080 [Deinococcus caeni]|uniref:hypothetical protein n=1 Tax=Deinococcus caeni TaxID=569127 RepID=UPI0036136271